jgi:membrane-bound metal-dependent hydrolase YbcI (DUF457 family)
MEPLLHVVVPFTALVLLGIKPRAAAPLALLGVLPDLDALLLTHRSLSHSVIILSLAWAPILAATWFRKPELRVYAVIGLLVLVSHPVIDMMGGYTPVLWPLLDDSISVNLALNGHISEGVSISPTMSVQSIPTVFQSVTSIDYPLFTGEGMMISLILLTPIALDLLKKRLTMRIQDNP